MSSSSADRTSSSRRRAGSRRTKRLGGGTTRLSDICPDQWKHRAESGAVYWASRGYAVPFRVGDDEYVPLNRRGNFLLNSLYDVLRHLVEKSAATGVDRVARTLTEADIAERLQ